MKTKHIGVAIVFLSVAATAFSQVRVYEGQETIPTYVRADDVLSPVFYSGRGVQGAAGKVYPYPAQTNLGDKKVDVAYDMVYLENEYIKVSILPAFGGRLFGAVDKTNGYDIIHRNTTVKPDLIGTLGAWVSGGIEWCFPHHHRTSSLLPVDYRLVENEDGSATVWVGETERTNRLRGIVGISLHPGRSYFQVEYRLNNTTDRTQTFLFWANASMTANENYRTFWPPSQEIGVYHNNNSFTNWPISSSFYNGYDYSSGVDLTWWKNHPSFMSFFFWDAKEGFVGGYDYGESAGTVHVGNVHENKTSKLWQFGPGTQGQAARAKLTDDGKAYVELMTGSFSNNQPDYSWFAPHSVKDAVNYYYGIRDIEMAKNANKDAAVTLQMRDPRTVFYGFNTTRTHKGVRVSLMCGEKELVNKLIDIGPAHPFTAIYDGGEELDENKLSVSLTDREGRELITYKPYRPKLPELPEVQEEVEPASEIESVEDLYLAGRFVEQFSRPFHNPEDYYLAALEKSPDDYRVNLALGMLRVHQWRHREALEYLQKAADKLRVKYFQPKEGELYYYMGLAQKALGMDQAAYENLYRATWYYEWFSPGNFQLALMEGTRGNFDLALEFISEAHTTNTRDGRINLLYASLLRKAERKEEALQIIDRLMDYDPLNFAAYYEKGLILGKDLLKARKKYMSDVENIYLEIATQYMNAGLHEDAISLLGSLEDPQSPLICFYLAWCYGKTDQDLRAMEMLRSAAMKSTDYCFPFRQETEEVLSYALEKDPGNTTASYLLGNLLYDYRKEEAVAAWENAAQSADNLPMIWRNLAFAAFHHEKDTEKAIDLLEKALGSDRTKPLWYAELTRYYDASERDYRKCLALLEDNLDVVLTDVAAPKEVVKLLNLNGDYDKAIDMLKTHHFRTWEGGSVIHSHYVDAHVLRALERNDQGDHQGALEDLEAALLYPSNLEVGKPNHDGRGAQIWCLMGDVYESAGKGRKAKIFYEKAAAANHSASDLKYFQARAQRKLGDNEKSSKLFTELIQEGASLLEEGASVSLIAVDEAGSSEKDRSQGYYLQALGKMGLGEKAQALKLLERSLDVYSKHLWARFYSGGEKTNSQ